MDISITSDNKKSTAKDSWFFFAQLYKRIEDSVKVTRTGMGL